MARLAKTVSRNLVLARLDYLGRIRQAGLPVSSRGRARFFLDLQLLAAADEKLAGGIQRTGISAIPFQHLLSELSGFYRNIFRLAESAEVRFFPTVKSTYRALFEFNPYHPSREVGFPGIKEELHWLLGQELSPAAVRGLVALVRYNFSVFHELLHQLFALLLPPPGKGVSEDYLDFIEAIVLAQERYLSAELGPVISGVLRSVDTIRRVYTHPARLLGETPDRGTEFRGLVLSHLGYLRHWPKREMRERFPAEAPFIDDPEVFVRPKFIHVHLPSWKKKKIVFRYPSEFRKGIALPRLSLKTPSLEALVEDPAPLQELWNWHRALFRGDQAMRNAFDL